MEEDRQRQASLIALQVGGVAIVENRETADAYWQYDFGGHSAEHLADPRSRRYLTQSFVCG